MVTAALARSLCAVLVLYYHRTASQVLPTEQHMVIYDSVLSTMLASLLSQAYEGLHRSVTALSEALELPMPGLAEDAFSRLGVTDTAGPVTTSMPGPVQEYVFEDPEVRAFYENLPDLRSLVPAVLLSDATSSTGQGVKAQGSGQSGRRSSIDDMPESEATTALNDAAATGDTTRPATGTSSATVTPGAVDSQDSVQQHSDAGPSADDNNAAAEDASGSAAAAAAEPSSTLDLILSRLPTCVSRDVCDELSVNFCYCNSKGARKRLVRALIDVPRGSLQLIPYYARVAAILSQVYPEMGQGKLRGCMYMAYAA